MATQRLASVASHLNSASYGIDALLAQRPDDVVITLAIRTPLTKSRKGGLKDTTLDGLVFKILQQVLIRSKINPELVEDICLGNVRDGKASYFVRAALLAAGFPVTTTSSSISRFCSSGLTATQHIAGEIISGAIEIGVAVGAETLSQGNERLDRPFDDEILQANEDARDSMQPMGQTSENVSKDFGLSRQIQDEYAVESYRRAEQAQKSGWFDDEIVPITVKRDGKDVTLSQDEIRWGTTYQNIAKLKPSFPDYGDTTHAGNASQITDGAAAVMLMKRSKALELGQPILAKFVGIAASGVRPRIMGIAPVFAIPKLMTKYNLSLKDVDVVEINEAFASMAVYCRDNIEGLEWSKMNPRGGAIAVGHPFGATGIRQIVCGLSECRRIKGRFLVTSMCQGTGQGMACLFVNEIR